MTKVRPCNAIAEVPAGIIRFSQIGTEGGTVVITTVSPSAKVPPQQLGGTDT